MSVTVEPPVIAQDAKKVFRKLGTCSRTFFYLLNREFGHLKETEEHAVDTLAGGIMKKGYQCGMLWGSTLAAGAESYRRYDDFGQASNVAINATQNLMESFSSRTKTISCREITKCDFLSKLSMAKYFFSGRFLSCFTLAEKWAPEAIQAASESLSEKTDIPQMPVGCASQVVKKMGGSDEEMVMVSGFAGGLGLSGNACGALSAAIWMNTMKWLKNGNSKSAYPNPYAKNTLEIFNNETDGNFLCSKICGKSFSTTKDHAAFIISGGCNKLIDALAQS